MAAAYGLYTHIQSNKRRSIALLLGLFFLVYVMVFAGALVAEALAYATAELSMETTSSSPPSAATGAPFGLTAREVEVLRLVAQGLTNAQVAERLFVTSRTVNAHLTSVYAKLGVEGRAAAIRRALDLGLR